MRDYAVPLAVAAGILAFAAWWTPDGDENDGTAASHEVCIVTNVVDGGTFDCEPLGRVRPILIDSLEVGEPGAEAATQYTTETLLGETVELERDVSDRGPYGRLLRYVWLDGRLWNAEIVAAGHAEVAVYPPDTKHEEQIRNAAR